VFRKSSESIFYIPAGTIADILNTQPDSNANTSSAQSTSQVTVKMKTLTSAPTAGS
jgi:hypothetical protein